MVAKRSYMVKFNVRGLIKWKTMDTDSWLPGSSAGERTLLPGRQAVIPT